MASRSTQIRFLLQAIPTSERGTGHSSQHDVSDNVIQARCEAHLAAVDVWAAQGGNDRQVKQAGTGLVAVCAWYAVKGVSNGANIQAFQRASGLSPAHFATSVRDLAPALQRTASSKASSSSVITTPQKPSHTPTRIGLTDLSFAARTPEALAQRAMEIAGGSASKLLGKRSPATPSRRGRGGTPMHGSAARVYRAPVSTEGTSPLSTPTRSGLRDRSVIREREVYDPSPAPVTTPTKRRGRPPSSTAASPRTPQSMKRVRLEPGEESIAQPDREQEQAQASSPKLPAPEQQLREPERIVGTQKIPDRPLIYPMTLGYQRHRPMWDADAARKCIEATLEQVRAMLAAETSSTDLIASNSVAPGPSQQVAIVNKP